MVSILEMLKFFNTLYQRGLLDPDSMTQTYNEMIDKVLNGGVFFSIFNYAGSLAYNTEEHIKDDKMMLTMKPEGCNSYCIWNGYSRRQQNMVYWF